MIKPVLEAATSLELSTPEEPEMALARGAALASANAPLFASSTAALAYALDPGTGEVDPLVLAGCFPGYLPEYRAISQLPVDVKPGKDNVAYSAVPDEDADANTGLADQADDAGLDESPPQRRPILLLGSALAVIFISAVVALEIALAISIRPTVALRPNPNENLVVPTQQPPPAGSGVRPEAASRIALAGGGAQAVEPASAGADSQGGGSSPGSRGSGARAGSHGAGPCAGRRLRCVRPARAFWWRAQVRGRARWLRCGPFGGRGIGGFGGGHGFGGFGRGHGLGPSAGATDSAGLGADRIRCVSSRCSRLGRFGLPVVDG